jgi:hypothetical protein
MDRGCVAANAFQDIIRLLVQQSLSGNHTRETEGVEMMHIMRKGQVKGLDGSDVVGQAKFVESLFGIAA